MEFPPPVYPCHTVTSLRMDSHHPQVNHQEAQENSSETTRKLGVSSRTLQEKEEIPEMISLKKI